jgi:homoserine kinase
MPGSIALVDRLRAAGHAAVVSGAGPTVLVLAVAPDDDRAESPLLRFTPPGWSVLPLQVDALGTEVLVGAPEVSSG